MTADEQRIAIAEACPGWTFVPENDYVLILESDRLVMRYFPKFPEDISGCLNMAGVPDYPKDLNAMQEAYNSVSADVLIDIYNQLASIVAESPSDPLAPVKVMRATAAQRAEAFLRTIGKWESRKTDPALT